MAKEKFEILALTTVSNRVYSCTMSGSNNQYKLYKWQYNPNTHYPSTGIKSVLNNNYAVQYIYIKFGTPLQYRILYM